MDVLTIIGIVFLIAGVMCCITTSVGMFRLPDFYSRCHSSGVTDTLGLMCLSIGFMIIGGHLYGSHIVSIKLVVLFILICVCNPIGSHALARAAYKSGFPMVTRDSKEGYSEDDAIREWAEIQEGVDK